MRPEINRLIRTATLAGVTALASGFAVESSPAYANHTTPEMAQTSQEKVTIDFGMSVIDKYVNFQGGPFTKWIGDNIHSNPREFIEIVGPDGAPGFFFLTESVIYLCTLHQPTRI